jgi:MOSC domain-containing protein YiiM
MTSGTLLAVCRVHALHPDKGNGTTAIDKRPFDGPVRVRPLGVFGDVQADRKHHGGPDKAVYAYGQEDADSWARELGYEVTPGLFGENLRTSGINVSGAVIGERWQVGDRLVLEVTSPRVPCGTFQRRLREPHWVKRFTEKGLTGAYLRVVRAGDIQAGNAIEVLSRPDHGVSVFDWFTEPTVERMERLQAAQESGEIRLSANFREYFAKVRARSGATAAAGPAGN